MRIAPRFPVSVRRCTGWNLVPQLHEAFAELPDRNESERGRRYLTWKQLLTGPKSDRADLDYELVEETGVVELPDKLATADEPEIHTVRGSPHLVMHGANITSHKPDIRVWNAGKLAAV